VLSKKPIKSDFIYLCFTIKNIAKLDDRQLKPYLKALKALKKKVSSKFAYGKVKITTSRKEGRKCCAVFDDDKDTVVLIHDFLDDEDLLSTIIHEIGHRVWFLYKTNEERKQVYRLFRKHKPNEESIFFPTAYSRANTVEFFAENFVALINKKRVAKELRMIISE